MKTPVSKIKKRLGMKSRVKADNGITDLFASLKGGGSNFGIVTSYKLQTFPQDHKVHHPPSKESAVTNHDRSGEETTSSHQERHPKFSKPSGTSPRTTRTTKPPLS
jgi:hypothetical protein